MGQFRVTRDGENWNVRLGGDAMWVFLPEHGHVVLDTVLRDHNVPREALVFDPESDRADFEARFGPDPEGFSRPQIWRVDRSHGLFSFGRMWAMSVHAFVISVLALLASGASVYATRRQMNDARESDVNDSASQQCRAADAGAGGERGGGLKDRWRRNGA